MHKSMLEKLTGLLGEKHLEELREIREQRQDLHVRARTAAIDVYQKHPEILEALSNALRDSRMDENEQRMLLITAWKESAKLFAPGCVVIPLEQQNALARYVNHFHLSLEEINDGDVYTNLMKSAILRDVQNGLTPALQQEAGGLPFQMEQGETLVWVFEDVQHHRTVTIEDTGTVVHSLNMMVAPGVQLGSETFSDRRVERRENQQVDTGLLGVTDLHLHFSGALESFRLGHNQIQLRSQPDPNGLGFQFNQDDSGDNPQRFINEDGRFAHQLAVELEVNLHERKEREGKTKNQQDVE